MRGIVLPTSALEYDLPADLIATHPARPRDSARLLAVDRRDPSQVRDLVMRDLPDLLRPGDLLVYNTTRVLPARVHGERVGTGGKMEGLYLHDLPEGGGDLAWACLIRGRHTRAGAIFDLYDRDGRRSGVQLTVIGRPEWEPGAWTVRVSGHRGQASGEILGRIGWTPLPPYIVRARRDAEEPPDQAIDPEAYQTVYAEQAGSVAAPTAGLHFTPELLRRLGDRGVGSARVVLHVGAGTFRPVETEFVEDHPMHAEWCSMSPEAMDMVLRTRAAGGRVIPVGTTAARTLESYAQAIENGANAPACLETRLLIAPGYRFRWTDGLLTNFHLPRSTLLALVAALFEGDSVGAVRGVYRHAVARCYRFYSYGDACLIV